MALLVGGAANHHIHALQSDAPIFFIEVPGAGTYKRCSSAVHNGGILHPLVYRHEHLPPDTYADVLQMEYDYLVLVRLPELQRLINK